MSDRHRLQLVDSTLREGEQHPGVSFTHADRIAIAQAMDQFGIDVIEMPTPFASPQANSDLKAVCDLDLRADIAAHCRCRTDEIRQAADCGADQVNVYIGSSRALREHGHGLDLNQILQAVDGVAETIRDLGIKARFSCEDAFRTPLGDVVRILLHAESVGFSRVGLADTVGAATPQLVADLVGTIRRLLTVDIEFHGHNDGGCAVANAHAAYQAGANFIDVTALGLGERNGIAPLSDFIARMWISERESVARYDVALLTQIDALVANLACVPVPFSACISGAHVFTHKAGPHVKAVVSNPETYEAINPSAFGRERVLDVGHRLTGRHAIAHRARGLGIQLSDDSIAQIANRVKSMAEERVLDTQQLDALILNTNEVQGENHGNAI